jgi:DNA-binding Lrp family transcriptional regulator
MLIDDPTRSLSDFAKKLQMSRQTIWREKKNFENTNTIWGYSAIIDESKINHVMYVVLSKAKPGTKEHVKRLIDDLRNNIPPDIRLISSYYTSGEFDGVTIYSAPTHQVARRYYEHFRVLFADLLAERPLLLELSFKMYEGGKLNPEIEKLYDVIAG